MSTTKPTQQSQTAAKVLEVLNVLMGHFAHGMTPTELSKATGLEPSAITRYVATLEATGFAERIPETGRIRPVGAVCPARRFDPAQCGERPHALG